MAPFYCRVLKWLLGPSRGLVAHIEMSDSCSSVGEHQEPDKDNPRGLQGHYTAVVALLTNKEDFLWHREFV